MPGLPIAVSTYLARVAHGRPRVVPLTGDASDRRYFRVLPSGGEPFVLAVYREPFDPASQPFINAADLFAAMPVPVPRILDQAGDLGVLMLEDLGDVTLQTHMRRAPAADREDLYREAVTYIGVIQRRGRELASDRYRAFGIAFDGEKLRWELDFFRKHFLEAYRGAALGGVDRQVVDEEFGRLAADLAGESRVLCHRDYHSRNLMVRHGGLAIIDFQDARLGPDTYDLASLLCDAYVEITEAQVDALIAEFLALTNRSDAAGFRERFNVMALQRTLKALGTFGHQAAALDNPVYIQYMPRALQHARRTLHADDRFARLTGVLGRYLPEVA